MAQALCDYVIYEKGYRRSEAVDAEILKWPPARDYVPFKVKLEWYKKYTNFRVPEEWPEVPEGETRVPPEPQLNALMNMRPMGGVARDCQLNSWDWRSQQVQAPVGQSYYDVVAVAIDEEHEIVKVAGVSIVIFCKEQILEWVAGGKIVGWPTASLSLQGLESRGAGPYDDPRDMMPRCDWVTLRQEEEIQLRVGRMRDAVARRVPVDPEELPAADGGDDDDNDPARLPSHLSTISETSARP